MRYIEGDGDGGRIVWSASDLKAAAECEFAWLRQIDAKLGRVSAVEEPQDLTLERAGRLGTQHELRQLEAYRAQFPGPGRVVELPETRSSDAEDIAAAVAATNAALADPVVDVIYQAVFSTDEFVGFADFLLRGEDGRWIVQDTKLARHARVTALMQPFVRGNDARTVQGSGLGLAIVKRIVDIHEGQLSIHNRPQGGLEAVISLPLKKTEADEVLSSSPLEKIKQTFSERF